MLRIAGGYSLSFDDAEAWALRNYPGIDIYNKDYLPRIITSHNKRSDSHLKNIVNCVSAIIDHKRVCFFLICVKEDLLSRPGKLTQFNETEPVLMCKALLFSHKDDKELAEKTQWITIIDPLDPMHAVWAEHGLPPSTSHDYEDYEDYEDVDYVDETDETDETVQGSGST